jgi:hypothetical protein
MQVILVKRAVCSALTAAAAVTLVACGGGGSGSSAATTSSTPSGTTSTAQTGSIPLFVSDASSDDWATIGVKILSIALMPQGGGSPVTVYTAPTPAPLVNLEELDQIAEILGNVTVPVGTYTGATVMLRWSSRPTRSRVLPVRPVQRSRRTRSRSRIHRARPVV